MASSHCNSWMKQATQIQPLPKHPWSLFTHVCSSLWDESCFQNHIWDSGTLCTRGDGVFKQPAWLLGCFARSGKYPCHHHTRKHGFETISNHVTHELFTLLKETESSPVLLHIMNLQNYAVSSAQAQTQGRPLKSFMKGWTWHAPLKQIKELF